MTENPAFLKLWNLLHTTRTWFQYEIYAKTTKELTMNVWNGVHPVEGNCKEHICKAGTKVRVWMVSRFGDIGITDNLTNPKGYDIRGLDADKDLTDYEFILKNNPMSNKREMTCTKFPDKDQFDSAQKAGEVSKRYNNKISPVVVFHCNTCGKYHIGRRENTKKRWEKGKKFRP